MVVEVEPHDRAVVSLASSRLGLGLGLAPWRLALSQYVCLQKPLWSTLSKRPKKSYQGTPKSSFSLKTLRTNGYCTEAHSLSAVASVEDDTLLPGSAHRVSRQPVWRKARPGCRNTGPDRQLEKGLQRWHIAQRKGVFSQDTKVVRRSY